MNDFEQLTMEFGEGQKSTKDTDRQNIADLVV